MNRRPGFKWKEGSFRSILMPTITMRGGPALTLKTRSTFDPRFMTLLRICMVMTTFLKFRRRVHVRPFGFRHSLLLRLMSKGDLILLRLMSTL
jgi:hypothetical protein